MPVRNLLLLLGVVGGALLLSAAARRRQEEETNPPAPTPGPSPSATFPANLDIVFKVSRVVGDVTASDMAKNFTRAWALATQTDMTQACPFIGPRSSPAIPVVSNPTVKSTAFGVEQRTFPVTVRMFVELPVGSEVQGIADCITDIWLKAIREAVGLDNAPTSVTVRLQKLG